MTAVTIIIIVFYLQTARYDASVSAALALGRATSCVSTRAFCVVSPHPRLRPHGEVKVSRDNDPIHAVAIGITMIMIVIVVMALLAIVMVKVSRHNDPVHAHRVQCSACPYLPVHAYMPVCKSFENVGVKNIIILRWLLDTRVFK